MNNQIERYAFLWATFLVLLGSICFSAKAVLVKLAYQHNIDSVSLMALRMLFSLPFFLAIGWYSSRQKDKIALTAREYLLIAALGICGFYLASLFDFFGLQYITASLERLVLFTYPTIVLILGALFLKKRITKIQYLAVAITYLGFGIAFIDNLSFSNHKNIELGVFLVFMAALAYAIYIVGSSNFLARVKTFRYNSIAMTAACLAVLIHHAIVYNLQLWNFDEQVYLYAVLMAVFSTVLPSFLIIEGISVIGAGNAAIISGIGPISTIVLAYIFLGETLSFWQWIGTLLVIGGVLLITVRK